MAQETEAKRQRKIVKERELQLTIQQEHQIHQNYLAHYARNGGSGSDQKYRNVVPWWGEHVRLYQVWVDCRYKIEAIQRDLQTGNY